MERKEVSTNAGEERVFISRQKALEQLASDTSEENLWEAIVEFQGYPFYTVSGLPFMYELKIGRNGKYNKELIVNRRKNSKTIVWSQVSSIFENALSMRGTEIKRPKALGDIRGVSYIYPLLYRFGIIEVPDSYYSQEK